MNSWSFISSKGLWRKFPLAETRRTIQNFKTWNEENITSIPSKSWKPICILKSAIEGMRCPLWAKWIMPKHVEAPSTFQLKERLEYRKEQRILLWFINLKSHICFSSICLANMLIVAWNCQGQNKTARQVYLEQCLSPQHTHKRFFIAS